ncbi:MAG: AAA family ATPase [Candidatus Nanopusillus acidilobi]|jgi:MinD-like ATPase involved in chromosome partitioning or flagellar assembly|nr:AAA family ATPase [Candidatus Nanopusillus sp.]MCG2882980.1 AAA family ATPase [Candidatus Nanopusillus sp.]
MAKVYTISSGKGGVGKTFFSINLSRALSLLNFKTLLIDFNLSTPNVSINLGLGNENNNIHKFLRGEIDIKDCIKEYKENFYIIPGSLDIKDLIYISTEKLHNGIMKIYDDFDYIIIDSAAGIGKEAVEALKASEEAIVITNVEKSSLIDAYRVTKVLDSLDIKTFGIVLNKVRRKVNYVRIERFFKKQIIGIIHYDENVQISMDSGIPLIDYDINSIASKDIIEIAEKITGKELKVKNRFIDNILKIFRWK